MSGCNGRLGMVLMLSVLLGCLGKTPNLTVDGLGDRCGDVGVKEIVPGEGRIPLGDDYSHVLKRSHATSVTRLGMVQMRREAVFSIVQARNAATMVAEGIAENVESRRYAARAVAIRKNVA